MPRHEGCRRIDGIAAVIQRLACLLLATAAATTAAASRAAEEGRVVAEVRVAGDLFATGGPQGPPIRQPISLEAEFDFVERPSSAGGGRGVARRYAAARATIELPNHRTERLLAADAADLLVTLEGTTAVPHLADGFLSREEAELLAMPFDSLLIAGLRPAGGVATGESWRIPGDLAAGLLAIDAIESGGLDASITAVTDGVAVLDFSGTVIGAVDGAPTRLEVRGTAKAAASPGEADGAWLVEGPIAELSATISERREAGWAAPGLEVEATISLRRLPVDSRPDARRLGPVASDRPAGKGRPGVVWHRHPQGRYALVLAAGWRVVEDGPEGLVMRLVDRGTLVAQCSILPLPRSAAEAAPDETTVREDVRRSLADQFGHLAESESTSREDGTRTVRVVADGAAENRPFRWIHHVLTGPAGHRVAVTFMLEPALADRFAAADRELVAGLVVLPDAPSRTAAAEAPVPQ